MVAIAGYESFNERRYSNPWVAIVANNGKIDFSKKVGGYTGGYRMGEAGTLYVENPIENQVYAYGQKDYRGNNGGYWYVQYKGGKFVDVDKKDLIKVLNETTERHTEGR